MSGSTRRALLVFCTVLGIGCRHGREVADAVPITTTAPEPSTSDDAVWAARTRAFGQFARGDWKRARSTFDQWSDAQAALSAWAGLAARHEGDAEAATRYLEAAMKQAKTTPQKRLLEHPDISVKVDGWSDDGAYVVLSGFNDNTVLVMHAASGLPMKALPGRMAALNHTGRYVATFTEPALVRRWDLLHDGVVGEAEVPIDPSIQLEDDNCAIAISADGAQVAVRAPDKTHLLDFVARREAVNIEALESEPGGRRVRFAPSGDTLTYGFGGWDIAGGSAHPFDVAPSPQGVTLSLALDERGGVAYTDITEGASRIIVTDGHKPRHELRVEGHARDIALNGDGTKLAAAMYGGGVFVWNLPHQDAVDPWKSDIFALWGDSVHFVDDDLIVLGSDWVGRRQSTDPSIVEHESRYRTHIQSVSWSGNSAIVVADTGGGLTSINLRDQTLASTVLRDRSVSSFDIESSSRKVLIGTEEGELVAWHAPLEPTVVATQSASVDVLAVALGGVITSTDPQTLVLRDDVAAETVLSTTLVDPVLVDVSTGGQHLTFCEEASDGRAQLVSIDLKSGRRVQTPMDIKLRSLRIAANGDRVVAHGPQNLWSWEPEGDAAPQRVAALPSRTRSISLSPDGGRAAGFVSFGQLFVVDIDTGHVRELPRDTTGFAMNETMGGLEDLAFSPDGRWLLVADDWRVWLYNVERTAAEVVIGFDQSLRTGQLFFRDGSVESLHRGLGIVCELDGWLLPEEACLFPESPSRAARLLSQD